MAGVDDSILHSAERGDALALARALVATPSVNPVLSPGGEGEEQVARLAARWLETWGFTVRSHEVAPGRWNVVGTLSGEGSTLLLNGHLDTVGVDGMTVDPFAAIVEEGRLWGRGACDMKGGVASLLAAARALSDEGPRPNLVVALTADEEHASLGMQALVEDGVGADMAVVCEPTRLSVMPAHKGFVWLKASFRGRAAHGSRPDQGVDAIRHAALYLAALDGYAEDLARRSPHPLLGHGSFHAGTIRGGVAESVYPEACEVMLERRTLPGEDPAAVVEEFRQVLEDLSRTQDRLEGSLAPTLHRPGTEVDREGPLVVGLLSAMETVGLPPRVEGMSAWVDAAFLNEAGIPAVCFGPGDIAQAHSADEWCEAAQILDCAQALERFARSLAEA